MLPNPVTLWSCFRNKFFKMVFYYFRNDHFGKRFSESKLFLKSLFQNVLVASEKVFPDHLFQKPKDHSKKPVPKCTYFFWSGFSISLIIIYKTPILESHSRNFFFFAFRMTILKHLFRKPKDHSGTPFLESHS